MPKSRTVRTIGGDELEISIQLSSQIYDCDAQCGTFIHEETQYVRVAVLSAREQGGDPDKRPGVRAAARIEKYHPSCWERIDAEEG